jgi:hypothetical protein
VYGCPLFVQRLIFDDEQFLWSRNFDAFLHQLRRNSEIGWADDYPHIWLVPLAVFG